MVLAAFVLQATLGAQTPPPQQSAPPKATASIRGHFGTADTGQPARRAQVRLTRAGGPGPGGPMNITATTDDDGNYEFSALPPGRFMLTARKNR